jgi:hypothetical protein
MEKISRIIPANSRTQSAEVSKSQPARPGSSELGRVAGRLTKNELNVTDRVEFSDLSRAATPESKNMIKEKRQAQVVQALADNFFAKQSTATYKNLNSAVAEPVESTSSEKAAEMVQISP